MIDSDQTTTKLVKEKAHRAGIEMLWAIGLSAIIVASFYLADRTIFPEEELIVEYVQPVPYGNVLITDLRKEDDRIIIEATFTKIQCEFQLLRVFGSSSEFRTPGEWDPVERASRDIDRLSGLQRLKISIHSDGSETYEIRTRHLCQNPNPNSTRPEITVDKLFATFNVEEEISRLNQIARPDRERIRGTDHE